MLFMFSDVTMPDGEITVTLYDRIGGGSADEDFLGYFKFRPPRIDGRLQDNWFRLMPRTYRRRVAVLIVCRTMEGKSGGRCSFTDCL